MGDIAEKLTKEFKVSGKKFRCVVSVSVFQEGPINWTAFRQLQHEDFWEEIKNDGNFPEKVREICENFCRETVDRIEEEDIRYRILEKFIDHR